MISKLLPRIFYQWNTKILNPNVKCITSYSYAKKTVENEKGYNMGHYFGTFIYMGSDNFSTNLTLFKVLTAANRNEGLGDEQKSCRTEIAGASSLFVTLGKRTMAVAASKITVSHL